MKLQSEEVHCEHRLQKWGCKVEAGSRVLQKHVYWAQVRTPKRTVEHCAVTTCWVVFGRVYALFLRVL